MELQQLVLLALLGLHLVQLLVLLVQHVLEQIVSFHLLALHQKTLFALAVARMLALLVLLGLQLVLHLVQLAQLALALTELSLQLALLALIQSVAATLVQQRMQQVLVVFQQPLWLCPMQCHHPLSAQQRVL